MKIKVITLKDICKYLAKISLVFGLIIIFAKFFYLNKSVNMCFSFNGSRYIGLLKNEIVFLKDDIQDTFFNKNNYNIQALNSEFGMFEIASNSNYVVSNNVTESNTVENIEDNNVELKEAELRCKYRSITSKYTR